MSVPCQPASWFSSASCRTLALPPSACSQSSAQHSQSWAMLLCNYQHGCAAVASIRIGRLGRLKAAPQRGLPAKWHAVYKPHSTARCLPHPVCCKPQAQTACSNARISPLKRAHSAATDRCLLPHPPCSHCHCCVLLTKCLCSKGPCGSSPSMGKRPPMQLPCKQTGPSPQCSSGPAAQSAAVQRHKTQLSRSTEDEQWCAE